MFQHQLVSSIKLLPVYLNNKNLFVHKFVGYWGLPSLFFSPVFWPKFREWSLSHFLYAQFRSPRWRKVGDLKRYRSKSAPLSFLCLFLQIFLLLIPVFLFPPDDIGRYLPHFQNKGTPEKKCVRTFSNFQIFLAVLLTADATYHHANC